MAVLKHSLCASSYKHEKLVKTKSVTNEMHHYCLFLIHFKSMVNNYRHLYAYIYASEMRAGLAKIDAVHKYNGFVRLHNALVRIGR